MENSQQSLATESFSYSWLTDNKNTHSPDRFLKTTDHHHLNNNFNFDVSLISSKSLIHADEIFSDGLIMPVYTNRSSKNTTSTSFTSYSVLQSPVSTHDFSPFSDKNKQPMRFKNSYRTFFHRFLRFLGKKTSGFSRKSSRVDDLERKVFEWSNNSLEASPRASSAVDHSHWPDLRRAEFYYGLKKVKSWSGSPRLDCSSPGVVSRPSQSVNSWCDAESPIHEAILYCKRSIEK